MEAGDSQVGHHLRVSTTCATMAPKGGAGMGDQGSLFEALFGHRPGPARSSPSTVRLPPGQYQTEKFPVLHYGTVPQIDLAHWDLRVWGEVEHPVRLTWEAFRTLPRRHLRADIHCVTRWSKLDTLWEGVPVREVLALARPTSRAAFVLAHAEQGYTANLPLPLLLEDDALLADTYDGRPLEPEHGWPLRLVVPRRYFWKSAKWLRGLEVLAEDRPGFWERYGYHNDADPWREERFAE
jgi:DMSO/TMAO reductase YedYZ molybdopterin-dependent catalytic subunit